MDQLSSAAIAAMAAKRRRENNRRQHMGVRVHFERWDNLNEKCSKIQITIDFCWSRELCNELAISITCTVKLF